MASGYWGLAYGLVSALVAVAIGVEVGWVVAIFAPIGWSALGLLLAIYYSVKFREDTKLFKEELPQDEQGKLPSLGSAIFTGLSAFFIAILVVAPVSSALFAGLVMMILG